MSCHMQSRCVIGLFYGINHDGAMNQGCAQFADEHISCAVGAFNGDIQCLYVTRLVTTLLHDNATFTKCDQYCGYSTGKLLSCQPQSAASYPPFPQTTSPARFH